MQICEKSKANFNGKCGFSLPYEMCQNQSKKQTNCFYLYRFAALQTEHEAVKSKLEVTEVKNDKMLVKLKAFKEKNDNLLAQIEELQTASSEQVSFLFLGRRQTSQ